MNKLCRLAGCFLLLCAVSAASAAESQAALGPARFTIITPTLVRIEYAPSSHQPSSRPSAQAAPAFTDAPTLFASDRSARFDGASIRRDGNRLTIDTGVITLTYTADNQPLNPHNLSAVIHSGSFQSHWTPGQVDDQNLGGTLRTLDGVSGPVSLGQGLLSRSGWALVDDSKSPILTSDWVAPRPNADSTDWYLFGYGRDYHAALRSLAAISGPVPLPRKNLLGIWYSRYWPYTSDQFHQIVQEYADHGFPLDNIVMDMDWHITQLPERKEIGQIWTGYTWDRHLIPDPQALLAWFHKQGLFVTLNDHPADGVQPHEAIYAGFMRAMGADPASGKILPFDAGDKKYLDTFYDFTHAPLDRMGVDFWWLDWQQYPNTRSVPTLTNLAWLNYYYSLRTAAGGRRGVSFSRWAGWGDHKFPIHFSGDAFTTWPTLAFEVPFTSTAGNVGCFFWSHDIGGHQGGRNEESYTRWCQFGALSASLRSHSARDASMDRRPWTYPKWAEDSMRISFRLRAQLFPYIYSAAAESSQQTVPLLRPMYFEHPDLEPAYHNGQQYFFGGNLLVAPIAMPGTGPSRLAWQQVWFPPSSSAWYNYFTGERHEPGSQQIVAAPIDSFPLFVRGGVPIPMQPFTLRPATAPLDHLVVRCYPGADNQSGATTLYEDDGQTRAYLSGAAATTALTYRRAGQQITVTIAPTAGHYAGQPSSRRYTLLFPCISEPTAATVNGATTQPFYDPATSTAAVEVPDTPIDTPLEIRLTASDADPQAIHQAALAHRLSGLLGRDLPPQPDRQLLASALAQNTDPALAPALLASAGMAILSATDHPYFFPPESSFRMHVPAGLIDSADATACLVSPSQPDFTTTPIPFRWTDGATIDTRNLPANLPDEDAIAVPSHPPLLRISATIAGHPCSLTLPAPDVRRPRDLDLASFANATASSSGEGTSPSAAIDGVADGWPGQRSHEWSTNHEKAGASLTLTWKTAQTISRIHLYDRPNEADQVSAGRIVFSDGTSVPFGPLPNDGRSPLRLNFPPRTIRSLRIEITAVKPTTANAGLSEVAVFK